MGTGKKERNRLVRQGKSGSGMDNIKVKGENFYRDAKKLKVLNMRKDGKPQRNKNGDIVQAAAYQSRDAPVARIEPNRRWFANTRVISQESLSAFRDAMAEKSSDPYQVLLKTNKLPMSLIRDGSSDTVNGLKQHKAKMTIETAPFEAVFGPKAQRKRVKLDASSFSDLAESSEKSMDTYKEKLEQAKLLSGNSGAGDEMPGDMRVEDEDPLSMAIEPVFSKGQSKRIWNELYKVIDSSDVILHVLDARNPLETRCRSVEKYIREEAPHKHLVFVLNKVDLVPTSVAATWVRRLSKEVPTLAFHSSITNSFGKGSLIQLLRQFSQLHSNRKQISVGLVGYPNSGKSSIINTLKAKKVCTVAPIPGETKVWQYITLMKRIYLIDCPGIVPPNQNDTPTDILLRGVVRVEKVDNPEQYIPAILEKVKPQHMERTYELKGWKDHLHFLELLARKAGKLLKGGEPDVDSVAKMVITDFGRGRIPWYTPCPAVEGEGEGAQGVEGREGRLGEMSRKRKRVEVDGESVPDIATSALTSKSEEDSAFEDEDEEEFNGFDDSDSDSDHEAIELAKKVAVATEEEDMIPLDALSDDEDEDDASEDG